MWRRTSCNILKQTLKSTSTITKLLGPTVTSPSTHYCSSAAVGGGGSGEGVDKNNGNNQISYSEVKRLMRLVNAEELKNKLGIDKREVIEYGELLEACQNMGLAKSVDEATAFSRILDEAGVVLLFRDKVYLHPDKVVDLVRKAIPFTLLPEDDPTQDEMKQLHEKMEEIDMLAHKQVRKILWTGLGLSVIQVGLFFRLTFWEFSWDVMEPVAFFTTTTGIVVGYAYFLITSRDPTYQDFMKRLFLSRQRKLIKMHNFDVQRFVELHKRGNSLQVSNARVRKQMGIEVEPEDLLHGH